MSTTWIAIPDASLADVIAKVATPRGLHVDPTWVGGAELRDSAPCLFTVAGHTVLYLGKSDGMRERPLVCAAFRRSIALHVDDRQWAELAVYAGRAVEYSVYGAADGDYVRVTGAPPNTEDIATLLARDRECDEVPPAIAALLTGIPVEDLEPERILRLLPRPFAHALVDPHAPPPPIAVGVPRARGGGVACDVETAADWPGLQAIARGPHAVVAHCDHRAYVIDTTSWPPRFTGLASGECEAAAFAPSGTLVAAVASSSGSDTLLVELARLGDPTPRWHLAPVQTIALLRAVGPGVVVMPPPYDRDPRAVPHLLSPDGTLAPLGIAHLPDASALTPYGAAPLGDGASFLVRWGERIYRVANGRAAPLDYSALPIDDQLDRAVLSHDGMLVIGLEQGGLAQIDPSGAISPVGADLAFTGAVHAVVRGPGEALIVVDHAEDVWCKIYWPSQRKIVEVTDAQLGGELTWDPEVVYYDAPRDQLVVIADKVYAVPWRSVS